MWISPGEVTVVGDVTTTTGTQPVWAAPAPDSPNLANYATVGFYSEFPNYAYAFFDATVVPPGKVLTLHLRVSLGEIG